MSDLIYTLLFSVLLAACSPIEAPETVSPKLAAVPVGVEGPATDEGLALVWGPVFGQAGPAPTVIWMATDCPDSRSFNEDGECDSGAAWPKENLVKLALLYEHVSLASVPFTHELCHIALFNETGDAKPDHDDVCFGAGGRAFAANGILSAARL